MSEAFMQAQMRREAEASTALDGQTWPVGQPTLPYPEEDGTATSGWSGSETSKERARDEAATGTATERQRRVLGMLAALGSVGLTVVDLRAMTGWHHGQASAALSNLHKNGTITRLTERDGRCQIYVLPEFVNGREEAPYRPNGRNRTDEKLSEARGLLERYLEMRKDFTQGSHLWRELDRQVETFLRGGATQ